MRLLTFFVFALSAGAASKYDLPALVNRTGSVRDQSIAVPGLENHSAYSLLFSVDPLTAFGEKTRVVVTLRQGTTTLVHKTLHLGDPDVYAMFHAAASGAAQFSIAVDSPLAGAAHYRLQVNRWSGARDIQHGPSHGWQDATPVALGTTIFASSDEAPYIPLPGTTVAQTMDDPAGEHWYRFDFQEPSPKLVFFQLDLTERDNLPVDVAVFRVEDGRAVPFNEGADPVSPPHEVQALPGNKFTTRILREAGPYYIRVRARHPEYKLRTRVYDPPPYSDPRTAVQTAVDYIMGAGDSWHANTPRRGGVFDRVANVHQETSLCVACHPTHFSQRAQLYAASRGYQVHERQQLQFLAERFYNNPRPFYGFEQEGAVWARVISAAANVLSRMSVLLDMYESGITGERREQYHRGVAEYLKLYYKDRTELPPDETNGNTPLVSAYEVAWYSWRVTRDPRMAALIPQDHVHNLVDLCYQTQALADIDREKFAGQIRANAERILSLQRPDGQWAMRFEPTQPEAEFQTGHALWALHAAGIPREHPQVAKALAYLLGRQQPFGGWMDPLQSYENFRTPFRETQMAVLALASYFPAETGPEKGWHSTIRDLPKDPAALLTALDDVWDPPSPAVLSGIVEAAGSNDALVRQAAVEGLGRVASVSTLPQLTGKLGDPSKLVQRTAAWAIRQVYSRHPEAPPEALTTALSSQDARVRWGATRVFATHFSALARRPEFARALLTRVDDAAVTVRMQALKGLWQYWFWTPDSQVRGDIEDAFLRALDAPQHPWVERNLREGIYNLADENIRYFYNNWVPLLADPADRRRVIQARLAVEDRLADKFIRVLESGSVRQKKMLLAGLGDFHLRHAEVYDLKASLSAGAPPVYNRIGNDTEQIVFFGAANERFAAAILPLLDSPDRELRDLAAPVALLARTVKFPGVNEVAGPAGPAHEKLAPRLNAEPAWSVLAKAFLPPPPTRRGNVADTGPVARKPLDAAFFQERVRPVLEHKGKDGYACVQCHATHTLFNGSYESAVKVVDPANPESSLLLRKPTSGSETEGVLGSSTLAHGGGVRWEKSSPEYATILQWIQGSGR